MSEQEIPVRLTRRAEHDLRAILDFLAGERPSAAERLADRFGEAFGHLARNPRLGKVPVTARLSRRGFRCFVVGKYLCFYKLTMSGVLVHRVVHGARNYQDFL